MDQEPVPLVDIARTVRYIRETLWKLDNIPSERLLAAEWEWPKVSISLNNLPKFSNK